jgi:hypothetical protein
VLPNADSWSEPKPPRSKREQWLVLLQIFGGPVLVIGGLAFLGGLLIFSVMMID